MLPYLSQGQLSIEDVLVIDDRTICIDLSKLPGGGIDCFSLTRRDIVEKFLTPPNLRDMYLKQVDFNLPSDNHSKTTYCLFPLDSFNTAEYAI